MLMLSICNGRERDHDDWAWLFKEADIRFKFVKAYKPQGSALGLIEAVWEG